MLLHRGCTSMGHQRAGVVQDHSLNHKVSLRRDVGYSATGNLPSMQEALHLIPRTPKARCGGHTSNPSTEGTEVGLILSYRSLRPGWDT